MLGRMAWLAGNLSVRSRAELTDARSVVGRLKESGGLVIARIAGDQVVIRPHGHAALTGWLDESFVDALIFLLGAGAFARSAG